VEICPQQKRKLELVSQHRKSEIIELRDIGLGKFVAAVRKI